MCLEKETFDTTQTILLTILLTIKATYSGPVKIEALQSYRVVQILPDFYIYIRGDELQLLPGVDKWNIVILRHNIESIPLVINILE